LLKNKIFSNNRGAEEVRELYLKLSDPLGVFLDSCVVSDQMAGIQKDLLYTIYVGWCKSQDLIPKYSNRYIKIDQQRAEVAKWSKAAASRAALAGVRGFKSLPPHIFYHLKHRSAREFSPRLPDSYHRSDETNAPIRAPFQMRVHMDSGTSIKIEEMMLG
jgi:hypothetical protein